MGQVLHGSATTTEAIRRAIQHSQESLRALSKRHGLGRLPDIDGDKPAKKKLKSYPIGYFHIDIAEVQTAEGKLYLFVAIDRTSKFAFVELQRKAGKMTAAQFLRNLIEAVPYAKGPGCGRIGPLRKIRFSKFSQSIEKSSTEYQRAIFNALWYDAIHTVLTDNGIQFTNRACDRYAFHHIFDRVCDENEIEHRLTKVKHPWTNGQLERMNRTIKEATVKRYH